MSHEVRVAAGIKSVLSNPNLSEETKDRAREQLDKLGVEYEDGQVDAEASSTTATNTEHLKHQVAGLKAALHNAHTKEESKEGIQAKLEALQQTLEERGEGPTTDAEIHEHRVVGGLKAALHNARTSDEAKEAIREKLEKHGVDVAEIEETS